MLRIFSAGKIFHLKPGASVLEIGYTTGGHSIFAFEKLGFKVFGVDNFYAGLVGDSSVWQSIKTQLNSKADFRVGDITKPTSYESNSLDMVYSASTVEHILDLPAAFAEMYRILKPGGAMVHNFSPYYCADGGHALGIGDAPWGHVRMSRADFIRYAREFRPYEANETEAWFADGLQVDMPQRRVQRYVSEAGFRIGAWMAKPSSKRFMQEMTADVIRDCFIATPDISIDDLMARSVNFVAIKD
jgi:SAM-dependent methyltransferase